MQKKISLYENIYSEQDNLAKKINEFLTEKDIFTINILGGAGAGKTSTLIQTIKRLNDIKSYVIEGDIESDIDTKTLTALGVTAFQINTGGNCHLNPIMVDTILKKIDICQKGVLFIENIGNLVCPADVIIGEHIKILICSIPEGSDKPYKYPLAFQKADAIILNKMDLKPYIDFDSDFFYNGVRALNDEAKIFEVCSKTGEGFDSFIEWLRKEIYNQNFLL